METVPTLDWCIDCIYGEYNDWTKHWNCTLKHNPVTGDDIIVPCSLVVGTESCIWPHESRK